MMPAKDGLADRPRLSRRGRARLLPSRLPHSRPRHRRILGRCSVLFFAMLLAGLPAWPNGDALGDVSPQPARLAPIIGVLANRAMSLHGDPAPAAAAESPLAIANRPRALSWEGESPQQPASSATAVSAVQLAQAAPQPSDQPPTGQRETPRRFDPGDSIVKSIRLLNQEAERLTLAKNAIAVIDTKREFNRAEIANTDIAEVAVQSPTRLAVIGKEIGTTQLILWIGDQQQVFNINVELNLSALRDLVKLRVPTADVQIESIGGTIVLSGRVPDAATAEQIEDLANMVQGAAAPDGAAASAVRNQLQVAGVQQTLLRVMVAEVNKEALRELGINWAIGASNWSRDFFFANNLGNLNPTVFSSSGVGNVIYDQQIYSAAAAANGLATNVTFGFPKAEFQAFLNALRQNGLSKTLAEPNLVAISGQTATFLAGGEVPIPVPQGGVSGAITIEYKEFGVRLAFTPTVFAGQMVRLHVMSEISEAIPLEAVAAGLPLFSFTTRRVESTIECGNGQTFAIAGLLNDQVRATASKLPALGDIPILGTLFSSTSYQRSETEMVVLVTPQLVEPLEPHQVSPPPGSLMTEPNDFELFALQKLEGQPLATPEYDSVPRDHLPVNTRPGDAMGWPASQLALRGPWGLADVNED